MSGGHFDYDQYRIGCIADEVERIIELNGSSVKNCWGDEIGYSFSEETIEVFKEAVLLFTLLKLTHKELIGY